MLKFELPALYDEFVQVLPSFEMCGNSSLKLAVDFSPVVGSFQGLINLVDGVYAMCTFVFFFFNKYEGEQLCCSWQVKNGV
jgi:hypothetical protein